MAEFKKFIETKPDLENMTKEDYLRLHMKSIIHFKKEDIGENFKRSYGEKIGDFGMLINCNQYFSQLQINYVNFKLNLCSDDYDYINEYRKNFKPCLNEVHYYFKNALILNSIQIIKILIYRN